MTFVWYIEGKPQIHTPTFIRRVDKVDPATPLSEVSHSKESNTQTSPSTVKAVARYDTAPQAKKRQPAIHVAQIMSKNVVTVLPATSLADVSLLFKERRFRHIPVTSSNGELAGILSDRDVLRHLAERGALSVFENNVSVSEIMHRKVLTVLPDTDIRLAARTMFTERIGCLPVLDEAKHVSGIVTRSDVLRTIMTQVPLELWI